MVKARMNQPNSQGNTRFADIFVSLSGRSSALIVCAALILASITVLFRIVSIW